MGARIEWTVLSLSLSVGRGRRRNGRKGYGNDRKVLMRGKIIVTRFRCNGRTRGSTAYIRLQGRNDEMKQLRNPRVVPSHIRRVTYQRIDRHSNGFFFSSLLTLSLSRSLGSRLSFYRIVAWCLFFLLILHTVCNPGTPSSFCLFSSLLALPWPAPHTCTHTWIPIYLPACVYFIL